VLRIYAETLDRLRVRLNMYLVITVFYYCTVLLPSDVFNKCIISDDSAAAMKRTRRHHKPDSFGVNSTSKPLPLVPDTRHGTLEPVGAVTNNHHQHHNLFAKSITVTVSNTVKRK